ncbi:SusD/RagB family nutrient-binding outer membrane lipoprotein [Elizabethkingia anophelis]|uniref:SusD/RagB family nutrient-binding outer membrane lipoprotein n=1 Tax=Elizabethkingia anophelis TaxID=1117645 RepID=UPI000B358758|nr:SusD/RagB family nutrient-binding outer membrane lipoprotein [Elizabethkingia anophelis]MDV3548396.1 SusD/RagB family nutrient-binding outer membrane lipoprotein [Elizabethkingia anophelis]MDV3561977.1 SusD/RagB family nutrient-binding outer membrane lipoprotein [Elizabethkingia anophelis]MDV3623551.1 SusD/RagB family nutrient-binding outer membrane lipoprotein [Elizabethkingia anophelis]MDV3641721.1 SusD/RagB family nutrient-binding outer membrane lipoprotein [Elizabethkingia anophelis]MDV
MKSTKIYFLTIITVLGLSGCSKVEDYQDDPNRPTRVGPESLLPDIEINAFKTIDASAALASRQLTYINGVNREQYYDWQRSSSSFGNYDNIKQVQKMIGEAERTGSPVYKSLARFFRSYFFISLTETYGDIPYSEAVKDGIFYPKYDDQKSIYKDVLNELALANTELSKFNSNISGDLIYNGDLLKWRKLINSYRLRILMDLSKRADDSNLNVKQSFADIVNNPSQNPIMEGIGDSGALPFYNLVNNRYPYFNSNDLKTAYYMEQSFVDKLKKSKDPRLFKMAEKKTSTVGVMPDDPFSYYDGLYGSGDLGENSKRASDGLASRINPRYFDDPINEPTLLMGYAELQFILAEAAVRGWIGGNANAYYTKGISASMDFYKIGSADAAAYLAQPTIALKPNSEIEQIKQIMDQKHTALFFNTGWRIFYDQRRTGFPKFNTDGKGILNDGKIPKRRMYPSTEITNNNTNLTNAVNKQYPDGDNINGVMWLIK